MISKSNIPSHHDVGEIAKKKATEFQPSIKRWLTKATVASRPPVPSGAGTANAAADKNINNDSAVFEKRVNSINEKYNAGLSKFGRTDETFKIITTNVNSIQTFPKRQKIYNLLKADPEVLLLVDTRIKELDLIRYEVNNRSVISTNTKHRGVAFITKKSIEPEKFAVNDESGNLLAITVKIAGKTHGIVGIYGPCEDNVPFYETEINDVIKKLSNAGVKEIILAGDFNIQLGKKTGYATGKSRKSVALNKILREHNLVDHVAIHAKRSNTEPISFWRRNTQDRAAKLKESYQASRLDHVLTTLPQENIATKYLRFYPSDHAMTETVIKIKSRSGQTLWRLNR